jgi:hypothetical protein
MGVATTRTHQRTRRRVGKIRTRRRLILRQIPTVQTRRRRRRNGKRKITKTKTKRRRRRTRTMVATRATTVPRRRRRKAMTGRPKTKRRSERAKTTAAATPARRKSASPNGEELITTRAPTVAAIFLRLSRLRNGRPCRS